MDNRTIEQVRNNEDRLIDKNMWLEKQLDLYKSVIDEIQETLDYGKAMIQHDKDYDIGYNFLVDAEKINNSLLKVKESK